YWGQNSYGATNPTDTANWQTNLSTYCADDTVDVFPLAFLDVFFGPGDLPEINFANICSSDDDPVFPGSQLANCQFMATDIQTCQAAGKIITLSMGGATGGATFTSDAQAETFATLIWDLFLGGTSDTRPFGDAVGFTIDLDIEGGSSTGLAAFVTQIRTLAEGASKPYYISGAPQCPFPDAFLGSVIDTVGFDMIYVQFYNNFCGLTEFSNPNDWNFATWDTWANTVSPNPDVKVYIGAPAAPLAAGSGYVDAATLATIAQTTQAQFSSFGGVMLWDISQAVANDRFDASIKNALLDGPSAPTTSIGSTTSITTTTTTTTTNVSPATTTMTPTVSSATTTTSATPSIGITSLGGSGNCVGISAWSVGVAYPSGSHVTNGGILTAHTRSHHLIGVSGVWVNNGACTFGTSSNISASSAVTSSAVSFTASVERSSASSISSTARPSVSSVSGTTSTSSAIPLASITCNMTIAPTSNTTTNTTDSETSNLSRVSRFFKGA
ncbi:glycoside hydrolase, partial [Gymnopus androsaceus JB14]